MLIRFVINNFFSFGEQQEFNTIPNNRLKTLTYHKYKGNDFDVLKISSIYGANGAGKSNIVKSLSILQKLVNGKEINYPLDSVKFKLRESDEKQLLAIEFIQQDKAFYYAVEISDGLIAVEELYLSGLGKSEDVLIYERKTTKEEVTSVTFNDEFENDEKSQILKDILLEEFIKPNETILKLLSNRDNKFLKDARIAFKWFSDSLIIINSNSKPGALAYLLETDNDFKNYAEDLMCSFNIGITSLSIAKKEFGDFFPEDGGGDNDALRENVLKAPSKKIVLRSNQGGELLIGVEEGNYWVKHLQIGHNGYSGKPVIFELEEESDGTVRLFDLVPAFHKMITSKKVFVIDEIERSIHPLLIKELVGKFSLDTKTLGQLIFTTHESNLLDQDIFRQDEIWFCEKNNIGSTEIYSLSDFKEHKTIDVQKGYLNGRYGSIPFLANLKDLNWHKNDIDQ